MMAHMYLDQSRGKMKQKCLACLELARSSAPMDDSSVGVRLFCFGEGNNHRQMSFSTAPPPYSPRPLLLPLSPPAPRPPSKQLITLLFQHTYPPSTYAPARGPPNAPGALLPLNQFGARIVPQPPQMGLTSTEFGLIDAKPFGVISRGANRPSGLSETLSPATEK